MRGSDAATGTYRLQLHRRFTLHDASDVLDYLHDLGISHVYLSPILTAKRGSVHGYDVTDPTQINPELGGVNAWDRFISELKARSMKVLLDIVPNHMALSPENRAWMHVLRNGPCSDFARWFDVIWHARGGTERLLLPVLGDDVQRLIDRGEIVLEPTSEAWQIRYYDWRMPVEPRSSASLYHHAAEAAAPDRRVHLERLAIAAHALPDWSSREHDKQQKRQAADATLLQQHRCIMHDRGASSALEETAKHINSQPTRLRELLSAQVYRLCYWRKALSQLTHRRFFDITDLIGVRVEDPVVFRQTHKLIVRLVQTGAVSGVRIDHIDGLADPIGYLQQLRRAIGPSPRIFVEKILEGEEQLDTTWPVAGTSGYDSLNALNGMFVDPIGHQQLSEHFKRLTERSGSFSEQVRRIKAMLARSLFASELDGLHDMLEELADQNRAWSREQMQAVLVELSARLPVYRTYIVNGQLREEDRVRINRCFDEIPASPAARDLQQIMRFESSDATRNRAFMTRWQQFTGPLMAKGLEDTALYRDVRLVSLNEVGVAPENIETPSGIDHFHQHNAHIAKAWPDSLTATSTHDTKRSEDVRARIHVLSELAPRWLSAFNEWQLCNEPLLQRVNGRLVPEPSVQWLLFQCALGIWPLNDDRTSDVVERLAAFAVKAAREAKEATNWLEPDEVYEIALTRWVRSVFTSGNNRFLRSFTPLLHDVAWFGALKSLAQVLVKFTAPGVPDVYQGQELWDLSLVDPDNRRPVDFHTRHTALDELTAVQSERASLRNLLGNWRDGRIKLLLTAKLLHLRRALPDVFRDGAYKPLAARGPHADQLFAFTRLHENGCLLTVAPVQFADLAPGEALPTRTVWNHDILPVPSNLAGRWLNMLDGSEVKTESQDGSPLLNLAEVFAECPMAVLQWRG